MTKNIKLIARYSFLIIGLAILLLQAFPHVLFSHKITHENISLYSNNKFTQTARLEILYASALLKKSPLFSHHNAYEIYIANNQFIYSLLGPDFTGGSFARTNIFNNIVIRACDRQFKICISGSNEFNMRNLSRLIAHEVSHIDMRNELGFIDEYLTPTWKKEGIADYIAQSSSYTFANQSNIVNTNSKAYEYYVYRQIATHVIEVEGMSIEQYLKVPLSFDHFKHKF
jgi:hypothetical protein